MSGYQSELKVLEKVAHVHDPPRRRTRTRKGILTCDTCRAPAQRNETNAAFYKLTHTHHTTQ